MRGIYVANKYILMVLTEPVEGREEEFNDYYENTHLDEVLETTRLTSAQRFRLVDQVGGKCPVPYLAMYETEADNPKAVIENLNATRKDRLQSDALNSRTANVWVFEPIGPRHE